MKNNRAKINDSDTTVLISQLGDPSLLPGVDDLGTEGTRSIVLLDIAKPDHLEIYNQLHNSPDDYEVLDEVEHAGRYTVFVTIRYIRKGQCDIPHPIHGFEREAKSGSRGRQTKKRTPKIGFEGGNS